MSALDRSAYPGVAAYVDSLPAGLASYPDAQHKASLYRNLLDGMPIPSAARAGLPDPVRALVDHPRPVTSWVPTVLSNAVIIAIYDLGFDDVETFEQFAIAQKRSLFDSPLYSVLLRLASVPMLVRGAARRWGAFHRGSSLTVEKIEGNTGRLAVDHPPYLYDLPSRRSMLAGLQAVISLSGARTLEYEEIEITPERIVVAGTFS